MAYALDICDAPVSCHAWTKFNGKDYLALCPGTSDIYVYEIGADKKLPENPKWILQEHTQLVTGLDWNPINTSLRLVSCSQDRNAFVWSYEPANKGVPERWAKQLAVLRLERAATSCRWNHAGTKFLVTCGQNKIRVCTFQEDMNWWMSESFDTEKTSLTAEFFPDDERVLTSSTDRHCREITIVEDNARKKTDKKGGKSLDFVLHQWSSQGWNNACAISPSGEWIAFTSQDSFIRFVKMSDPDSKDIMKININGLPLLSIVFLSETVVVGAGFDCFPRVFNFDGSKWTDLGSCDVEETRQKVQAKTSALAAKAAAFGGAGTAKAAKTSNLHQNAILQVRKRDGEFSTCGTDGRVVVWPIDKIKDYFKTKGATLVI
jgi:actin related protein 2/3 complex subunit 1A/1B